MIPVLVMVMGAIVASTADVPAGEQTPGPSVILDLLDIQWWQALGMFVGALGLSPAPWLLGLAAGKIQFSAPAEREKNRALEEKERHYEALLALERQRYADLEKSNEKNAAAAETERKRANAATDAVLEIKDVVEANTHVIASVHQVAREAAGQS